MKTEDSRILLLEKEGKFLDTENPPIQERIKKGLTLRFSISKLDTIAFNESCMLIKSLMKKTNKRVIIYLPPFSSESFELLKTTPSQLPFGRFSLKFMNKKLNELEIPVIDSYPPEKYGLNDTYFIDGIHPGEVYVARQLMEHHKLFGELIDTTEIQAKFRGRFNNLLFNRAELKLEN